MDRRQFLRYSALLGFSLSSGSLFSYAQSPKVPTDEKAASLLKTIQIIDAHAHPD
jgi:hypothetical protein